MIKYLIAIAALCSCASYSGEQHRWQIPQVRYGFEPNVPMDIQVSVHYAASVWNAEMESVVQLMPAELQDSEVVIKFSTLGNFTAWAIADVFHNEDWSIATAFVTFNSETISDEIVKDRPGILLDIAVHEIGHVLGLSHDVSLRPEDPVSLEAILRIGRTRTLHLSDINAARVLYGLEPVQRSLTPVLSKYRGKIYLDAGTDEFAWWSDERQNLATKRFRIRPTRREKSVSVLWNGMTATVRYWRKNGKVSILLESQ